MSRIDDAVKRILSVKFPIGLFESPMADYSFDDKLGSQAHRDLAREAVRKSLVLLKNGEKADSPVLPLPKKTFKILVAGSHGKNLGLQCGGWTKHVTTDMHKYIHNWYSFSFNLALFTNDQINFFIHRNHNTKWNLKGS